MAITYNWGRLRKEAACHERGHSFKRFDGEDNAARIYKCKCGARASVTTTDILIVRADLGRKVDLGVKL